MYNLLSVETVMFNVLGYPMSYIEFFGTAFNLWCVWLAARKRVLNWPVGIVASILFFALFYEIRLYSDMLEQVYFIVTSAVGWWLWLHPGRNNRDADGTRQVTCSTSRTTSIAITVTIVGTLALGTLMANIHLLFPAVFPERASFPYLDAFTTVMSFVATVLMMRKEVNCWHYWIAVDVIGIWLYFMKDVRFISLEYVCFLAIAIHGYVTWQRELNLSNPTAHEDANRPGDRQVLPAA